MVGVVLKADEWRTARLALLEKEKEHMKASKELAKQRYSMPMTKVTTEYTFTGADAKTLSFLDLFEGGNQLIVYHFMIDLTGDPCKDCCFVMDNMPAHLEHLKSRHGRLVLVSSAPYEQIVKVKERMGWTMPCVSCKGTAFNSDFELSLNSTSTKQKIERGTQHQHADEQPGFSVFLSNSEDVYHSYSCHGQEIDPLLPTYQLLDLTPFGRQNYLAEQGLGFEFHDEYPAKEEGA